MPAHDWSRIPAGLFHEFHQSWSVRLKDALNQGVLPEGYYALVEQRLQGPEPDIIAVETAHLSAPGGNGSTTLTAPPKTQIVTRLETDKQAYARRANRISIRHPLGDVVAIIEIISPGNKESRNALRAFVQKTTQLIWQGIHVLIIDLFPPSKRDPQGIHGIIVEEYQDTPFMLPAGKPLTLVSYESDNQITAYVEPLAVGDDLPPMPLFLAPGNHVLANLERTYMETWEASPQPLKQFVTSEQSSTTAD